MVYKFILKSKLIKALFPKDDKKSCKAEYKYNIFFLTLTSNPCVIINAMIF